MVRAHDVKATKDAILVWNAMCFGRRLNLNMTTGGKSCGMKF